MKHNQIVFILDSFDVAGYKRYLDGSETFCNSFADTEVAISNKMNDIWTYDVSHLSFDLNDLGYLIYIGYAGEIYMIHDGMILKNGKEVRKGHNLFNMLVRHAFDDDLNLNDFREPVYLSMNCMLSNEQIRKEVEETTAQRWVEGIIEFEDETE